jgi:hypothetical protein
MVKVKWEQAHLGMIKGWEDGENIAKTERGRKGYFGDL